MNSTRSKDLQQQWTVRRSRLCAFFCFCRARTRRRRRAVINPREHRDGRGEHDKKATDSEWTNRRAPAADSATTVCVGCVGHVLDSVNGDAPSPRSMRERATWGCLGSWGRSTSRRENRFQNRKFQSHWTGNSRNWDRAHARAPLRSAVRPGTREGVRRKG